MKAKLFITVLTLSSSILFNNNVHAQSSKLLRSSDYMAINTSSSNMNQVFLTYGDNASYNEESSILNKSAAYMHSEQFVFDNLNALKQTFAISDIYFDLDAAVIRQDAVSVLNNLVNLMKDNPDIHLAATAYSDSRMSKYNENLATKRAQSAIDYLIANGVTSDRLMIDEHGRGTVANPCKNDPSCTLATQQLNRRTEFNVVYNGLNLGQIN